MNQEIEELTRQMYMASDEYASFRSQMMSSPVITPALIDGCIRRADKLAALVRILRGKLAELYSRE